MAGRRFQKVVSSNPKADVHADAEAYATTAPPTRPPRRFFQPEERPVSEKPPPEGRCRRGRWLRGLDRPALQAALLRAGAAA